MLVLCIREPPVGVRWILEPLVCVRVRVGEVGLFPAIGWNIRIGGSDCSSGFDMMCNFQVEHAAAEKNYRATSEDS